MNPKILLLIGIFIIVDALALAILNYYGFVDPGGFWLPVFLLAIGLAMLLIVRRSNK